MSLGVTVPLPTVLIVSVLQVVNVLCHSTGGLSLASVITRPLLLVASVVVKNASATWLGGFGKVDLVQTFLCHNLFVAAHRFAVKPASLLLALPSSLGQKWKIFISDEHASCEAWLALELTRCRLGASISGEAFVACLIECEISYLDEAEEQDGSAEEESHQDRHNDHQVAEPQNIAANTQLDQRTVCTVGAWCNQRLQTTDDDGDQAEGQRHQEDQEAIVVVDTNTVI